MNFDEYQTLPTQVFAYGELLREFIDEHGLPETWFTAPDHITFTCMNADHFDTIVREALDDAESATLTEAAGQRVVSILLAESLYIESFGHVSWLQIVLPEPTVGNQAILPGMMSMAFHWSHLEDTEAELHESGVSYTLDHAAEEHWLTISLNELGHDVVLTDRTVAQRIESALLHNDAEVIL